MPYKEGNKAVNQKLKKSKPSNSIRGILTFFNRFVILTYFDA